MFGTLFVKECKQITRSLVYYIFLVIFVVFMVSQLGSNEIVEKPQPGQENYGMKESTDKDMIMSSALAQLVVEIDYNSFPTYPTGFYKEVIVSDDEIEELKKMTEDCTGKTWDEIMTEQDEHYAQHNMEDQNESMQAAMSYTVEPKADLSYDLFGQKMERVCEIVGSGSDFEKDKYESGVDVPMTYEDAVEEYEALCKDDGITGAFMRLFCDYAVIVVSLLPIFLGVTRCVRDKRAKAQQVIYARTAKSSTIVLSRYLANVVMMFLPIVVLAFGLQTSYLYQAQTLGVQPHSLAFLLYTVIWIMPTILFVLAVSFLITELSNGIVAIIIQVFWAIAALQSSTTLGGGFGWNLIPRWNTFGLTMQYMSEKNALYQNRILYTVLAVVCITITAIIYGYKRGGGLHFYEKKH